MLPVIDEAEADLLDARSVLGEETFVAAEWIAATINTPKRRECRPSLGSATVVTTR